MTGGRLLGAFRMRHEKHTQSSSNPQAQALPHNAVAVLARPNTLALEVMNKWTVSFSLIRKVLRNQ